MPRVLVVSSVGTHPIVQGSAARVNGLMRALIEAGNDVTLLYVRLHSDLGDERQMSEAWGQSFHSVTPPRPAPTGPPPRSRHLPRRLAGHVRRFIQRWVRAWRGVDRLPVDAWYHPSIDDAVRGLDEQHSYDAVLVEYVFLSRALLNFGPGVRKFIDTIDAFAPRTEQFVRQRQGHLAFFPITRREERKGLLRADAVFAIQDDERPYFERLTGKPVVTVGHLLEVAEPAVEPAAPDVLFVGGDGPINRAAVRWFVHHAWPGVRRRVRGARFRLAGRIGRAFTPRPEEGVEVIGEAADLTPLYHAHAVVINPVQIGSGLAIKSVEALAAGRPLVATSTGARGLRSAPGPAVSVADDPAEFADAVVRLLRDAAARAAAGAAAASFAREWNLAHRASLSRVVAAPVAVARS